VEMLGIFPQARLAKPEYVDRVERMDAQALAPLFANGPLPQVVRSRLSGFDLAISFLSDPHSIVRGNLTAMGVKQVISFSNKMPTDLHTVHRLAEVLGELGLSLHDPVPRLKIGPKPAQSSRFGFHVGSGSPKKNWPIDLWLELTRELEGFFGDFLLVGGEADDKVVREFRARCGLGSLKTLLNATLTDLSQALNGCTIFAGHDTGVTHLAAAIGTPTVALFGPTDASVWAPLGEHVRVIRSPDGRMESIQVATVAETCRQKRVGVSA
jgi:heptosyltransferase III